MRLSRFAAFGFVAAVCLGPSAWGAGGAESGQSALPASRLQTAMTLYAGGITLGKLDMDATIRGDDYHLVANLETGGMVNALWQAEIQATSSGKIAGKTLAPALYDSFNTQRSKKQQVSLTYENGAPRLYADPVYSTTGYEVKPEEKKDTLDPLSAVMYIVSTVGAEAGNACAVTAHVFDGRRRYDVELRKIKDTQVNMDNGLYKGKALLCEIRYKQLAGFRPKLLKASDSFPKIYAWIASFPSAVTGRAYAVPLRVWANTSYGTIAAVATALKVDGTAPK